MFAVSKRSVVIWVWWHAMFYCNLNSQISKIFFSLHYQDYPIRFEQNCNWPITGRVSLLVNQFLLSLHFLYPIIFCNTRATCQSNPALLLWWLWHKVVEFVDYAERFFKVWNIQIRNSWKVSYMTHTKFVQKLSVSPSKEIRFLFKV